VIAYEGDEMEEEEVLLVAAVVDLVVNFQNSLVVRLVVVVVIAAAAVRQEAFLEKEDVALVVHRFLMNFYDANDEGEDKEVLCAVAVVVVALLFQAVAWEVLAGAVVPLLPLDVELLVHQMEPFCVQRQLIV
jgi:hypothetical protein